MFVILNKLLSSFSRFVFFNYYFWNGNPSDYERTFVSSHYVFWYLWDFGPERDVVNQNRALGSANKLFREVVWPNLVGAFEQLASLVRGAF